jgi:hypothetical protein
MRMGRIFGEAIYGLLPYDYPNGDGIKIWQAVLGKRTPKIQVSLVLAALIPLLTPYIIGALLGYYQDI